MKYEKDIDFSFSSFFDLDAFVTKVTIDEVSQLVPFLAIIAKRFAMIYFALYNKIIIIINLIKKAHPNSDGLIDD